jgi:hypothetical protein
LIIVVKFAKQYLSFILKEQMICSDSLSEEFEPRFVNLFAKAEILITFEFIVIVPNFDRKFQCFKLVA